MNEFWTKAKDQEEEFRSQINIFRGKNEINFVLYHYTVKKKLRIIQLGYNTLMHCIFIKYLNPFFLNSFYLKII